MIIILRILTILLLLFHLGVLALLLSGREAVIERNLVRFIGPLTAFNVPRLMNALKGFAAGMSILLILHLFFAGKILVPVLIILLGAALCFETLRYIDRRCRAKR